MNDLSVFDEAIEQKLLNLHTAFIAKIVSVKGGKADVQPLNLIKQYGQPAKQHRLPGQQESVQSSSPSACG